MMPSGTTPVPDGASRPMMIRCVAFASRARRRVWSAVLPLPQWTISSAICVATSASISRSLIEVVPPLMWPTTSGSASSTTSPLIALEPAMDGPPVWMVTVMPCFFAHFTMGAASLPALAHLENRGARVHLPPGRPLVGVGLGGHDGERLEPHDVLRPPGQVHLAGR